MELKSIEDWVVEKNFKAVPNIVDVASFGGPTREYQVRIDLDKLISYGLSIGQVEQQLTNNNANGGGSFIESGLQQINIRAGPERQGHRKYRDPGQRRHTAENR
jgi:cobalt-zinc-cadmium resistance protein CzcA